MERYWQVAGWSKELQRPVSIWLGGLFNPAALLVAMVQVASHRLQHPMNELTIETHFTRPPTKAGDASVDVRDAAGGGVLFHGLTLLGSRWTEVREVAEWYTVDKAPDTMQCGGSLRESRPKQLQVPLPPIYARAVQVGTRVGSER